MTAPRKTKKEENQHSVGFFQWLQNSTNAEAWHSTPVCSDGQCSIRPAVVTPLPHSSFGYTVTFEEEVLEASTESDGYLASILPPDYYAAMIQSIKSGFFYSFFVSTSAEIFNDYFKARHFTASQTFYANQCVKALTILALSSYLGLLDSKTLLTTIGAPVASIGLKVAGMSATLSQIVPTAVVVTTQVVSNLTDPCKTLMAFLSAVGAGWCGTQIAKGGYELVRSGFFAVKDQFDNIFNAHPVSMKLEQ